MSHEDISPLPPHETPTRIAFCITDLDAGGAERALCQIVSRLDRTTWAPIVLCLGPETVLSRELQSKGIPVHCYGARHIWQLGVLGWLTRKLQEFQPVILQTMMFHANLVGRIAAWRGGVPIVVAGHRVAEQQKIWHLWVDRWTRALVDHHVCVSKGVARHIQTHLHVKDEQLTVIPNGVELPPCQRTSRELRQELGIPDDQFVITAVGRLHPQKGFDVLVPAFSKFSLHAPHNTHLVIVGEGPERAALEREIQSAGLSQHVTLAGYRTDVADVLRASNLFVLSSRWEGMPNVVLEAMAAGLPVIATQVSGIDELIADGVQGIVVTPGCVDELSAAIRRVLTDPQLAKNLAHEAQHAVTKVFTWQETASKFDQLYTQLISRAF